MNNIRNGLRPEQSGRLRPIPEESAFETLLRAAEKLSNEDRQRFIILLLKHAFLDGGNACYVAWGKWNEWQRRSAYLNLLETSEDLASSWYEWAWALSNEGSSCRPLEKAFCLIGELTEQTAMEEVNQWLRG
jgi:hypothetical protein